MVMTHVDEIPGTSVKLNTIDNTLKPIVCNCQL